jgi:hypothetical protein
MSLVVAVAAEATQHPKKTAVRKTDCAPNIADIRECPDQGCGRSYDPELNRRKNVRSDNHLVRDMTFAQMQSLPDPVNLTLQNTNREELRRLHEGWKVRVVALALVARKGSAESCNCGLTAPKDTDNHIVLVDPGLRNTTLETAEKNSETAEFTPRVRLSHANFTREVLQSLISRNHGRLLVRVTGLLMFDSEHFLRRHLTRRNNWEIHPVLKMEYCSIASCSTVDKQGWVDLDNIRLVRTSKRTAPSNR